MGNDSHSAELQALRERLAALEHRLSRIEDWVAMPLTRQAPQPPVAPPIPPPMPAARAAPIHAPPIAAAPVPPLHSPPIPAAPVPQIPIANLHPPTNVEVEYGRERKHDKPQSPAKPD